MCNANPWKILYAYEDELGNDVIASLDFWQKGEGHKLAIENDRYPEKF